MPVRDTATSSHASSPKVPADLSDDELGGCSCCISPTSASNIIKTPPSSGPPSDPTDEAGAPESVTNNNTDLPAYLDLQSARGPFRSNEVAGRPGCPPNIYTNAFVTVRPSSLGGFGAFATTHIPDGTNILIEDALLYAVDTEEAVTLKRERLSSPEAAIFDSLSDAQNAVVAWTREEKWKHRYDTNRQVASHYKANGCLLC
jgi:hypothetical protein